MTLIGSVGGVITTILSMGLMSKDAWFAWGSQVVGSELSVGGLL